MLSYFTVCLLINFVQFNKNKKSNTILLTTILFSFQGLNFKHCTMKKLFILFLLQTVAIYAIAQDCQGYFAASKGTKMEMVSYDKKDKPTTTLKYQVNDIKSSGNSTIYVVHNETFDSKGRLIGSADMETKCSSGDFYMTFQGMGGEALAKAPDMEVTVTGDQMVYPNTMTAGQKLKDATVNIKSGMKGGMTLMNMTANITDRKVEGFETVETPAGKFDCVKITYTNTFRLMGTRTMKGVEYLAKGVGIVKSETYDDSGKKQSYMILTKLEK